MTTKKKKQKAPKRKAKLTTKKPLRASATKRVVSTKQKSAKGTRPPRANTTTAPTSPSWLAHQQALAQADPTLGRHMLRIGVYAPARDELSNLYEALAQAIVYQQLNGKAAATIFGRLKALGGASGFPSPAQLLSFDDATIRGAGISGSKMKALRDLAAKSATLPSIDEARALSDAVLVERLTAVRGIGRWTVEMLLIFRLGRPDVLPSTDYGIRQGFQRVFRTRALPTPQEISDRGERWRPYRTMAAWYLWRALDS